MNTHITIRATTLLLATTLIGAVSSVAMSQDSKPPAAAPGAELAREESWIIVIYADSLSASSTVPNAQPDASDWHTAAREQLQTLLRRDGGYETNISDFNSVRPAFAEFLARSAGTLAIPCSDRISKNGFRWVFELESRPVDRIELPEYGIVRDFSSPNTTGLPTVKIDPVSGTQPGVGEQAIVSRWRAVIDGAPQLDVRRSGVARVLIGPRGAPTSDGNALIREEVDPLIVSALDVVRLHVTSKSDGKNASVPRVLGKLVGKASTTSPDWLEPVLFVPAAGLAKRAYPGLFQPFTCKDKERKYYFVRTTSEDVASGRVEVPSDVKWMRCDPSSANAVRSINPTKSADESATYQAFFMPAGMRANVFVLGKGSGDEIDARLFVWKKDDENYEEVVCDRLDRAWAMSQLQTVRGQ